jgi:hypothetical protein
MAPVLTLAKHNNEHQYWEGGNYELNMSFDSLRDRQWARVTQAIWEQTALFGPLTERYVPNKIAGDKAQAQVPAPTATLTQHGQLKVTGSLEIGCDVLATRSLFECVSILVPVGMFEGLVGNMTMRHTHPELQALDEIFYNIALSVYDVVPFRIAAFGYERGCQLTSELRSDAQARHAFLVMGNFMAQEEVLRAIEPDLTPYKEVRPGLRWLEPRI